MNDDNRLSLMDEWLKNHFLDPLTSVLDETEFRIDVYETDKEFIVEALLTNCQKSSIYLSVNKNVLTIKAMIHDSNLFEEKQRSIEFPVSIDQNPIHAVFANEILEIFIQKEQQQNKKLTSIIDIQFL
ncbi:heat-shock protein Hsp20 [Niallia circulans]|uniref:Hsp20/alpha crystallin family protein n=1 Tax=Niallia circulans TaxID=1397 RepID=UPI000F4487FA|nr:Hsp20/alpha crystallin family protein [Niallia circulans]AYV66390.1 heat-shock protein Hsp20 [Niallia circulans]